MIGLGFQIRKLGLWLGKRFVHHAYIDDAYIMRK